MKPRTELVWVKHDGTNVCPVEPTDFVLIAIKSRLVEKSIFTGFAWEVDWGDIIRYKVIFKDIHQPR